MNTRLWAVPFAALLLAACGADESTDTSESTENTAVTEAADPYRLADNVAPTAQQLTLYIDPESADYSGSTRITVEVASESPHIRLHALDMEITSLAVSQNDVSLDVTHESGEHGLLTITTGQPIAAGSYEVQIEFSNNFNDDGVGINRTEQDGDHYIFSQFEAIDARQAFPCFDEPGFKFPWQMTMIVPTGVTPITNTPVVSITEEGDSKTVVFDSTPALPSYLIAVAVGPFELVPIEGMSIPGNVVVPRGKSHLAAMAVETTPPLLAYLEDYFGQPYPFKKLDLIATNQAFSGAMEHPGAITYSDFFLLLDETASASQKSTLIKITAHELAHQWFGNLVTMQWWNDLWLNESFADWMGDKTAEAVYPDFSISLPELRTLFRVMDMDARSTTKPVRHDFKSTDNFSDGIFLSYYKGKAVLAMFEDAVGSEIFRDGVVRYIRKFSRQNAVADDLWAEINAGAEFDLAGGLAGFVNQAGIPLISVSSKGNGLFEFSQRRLQMSGESTDDSQTWVIPLQYKYLVGDRIMTADLIVDEATEVVEIGGDVKWILPNAEQSGYYRWSIPDDMLTELGADAATHLSVRERMGLLTNLYTLLGADKLDGEDYLRAMQGVSRDTEAPVIESVLDQLGKVRLTFITPELREPFAEFLRDLLGPTLDRIGTETIPGESPDVTEMRAQVLLWLASYGQDDRAIAAVSKVAEQYLSGDVPPSDLAAVSLRTASRWGDVATFHRYRDRLEAVAKSSPGERRNYVRAIGSFRDPAAVELILEYILSGELQPVDIGTIIARLVVWEDNNEMLLNWVMQNDAALRELVPAGSMVDLPGQLMRCTTENAEVLRDFYSAPERFVAGIDSELDEAIAENVECAAFRERELESVGNYLSM
ncbi:MAG: M1 family metallopeptidase [Woeseiaceae bacterium]